MKPMQPGMHPHQPGMLPPQPGMHPSQPGMHPPHPNQPQGPHPMHRGPPPQGYPPNQMRDPKMPPNQPYSHPPMPPPGYYGGPPPHPGGNMKIANPNYNQDPKIGYGEYEGSRGGENRNQNKEDLGCSLEGEMSEDDASLKGPQKNEEENMNQSNGEASISEDNSIEKGNTKPTHNPKKENYGHGPDHAPPDSGPRPTSGAMPKDKSKTDGYPGPPPPGYRGPPPGYPPHPGMIPPGYPMGPPPNYRGPQQDMRDMRMQPHYYPNEEERQHMEHMNRIEEDRAKHMAKMGGQAPPPQGYRRPNPNMPMGPNYDPQDHYPGKKPMKKGEEKDVDEDIHYGEYGRQNPYLR